MEGDDIKPRCQRYKGWLHWRALEGVDALESFGDELVVDFLTLLLALAGEYWPAIEPNRQGAYFVVSMPLSGGNKQRLVILDGRRCRNEWNMSGEV
jgi:hypothetical protein